MFRWLFFLLIATFRYTVFPYKCISTKENQRDKNTLSLLCFLKILKPKVSVLNWPLKNQIMMDTLDLDHHTRPLSRRSEDSGLAASLGSSRGSSPVDMKLEFSSSMSCSTMSLNSSIGSSPTSENPKYVLKTFFLQLIWLW